MSAIDIPMDRLMTPSASFFQLPPAVQLHLVLALAALVLGPLALRARKGSRLHRASGYAWVALMLGAALTSVFIRDRGLPNLGGYTPIHLLTLLTFAGVGSAIVAIAQGRVSAHRHGMQATYWGGCVAAGAFALLPGRFLGHLVWHQSFGWV